MICRPAAAVDAGGVSVIVSAAGEAVGAEDAAQSVERTDVCLARAVAEEGGDPQGDGATGAVGSEAFHRSVRPPVQTLRGQSDAGGQAEG